MITTLELASIVYKIVNTSNFKTVINGDVYLGNRPTNSTKNDIVIGTLPAEAAQLQFSTVLVNIYAKDLFDGKTYTPDLRTLQNATKLLTPLFEDKYLPEKKTSIDIEYQADYKVQDGDSHEWVSVIRLKTRTINQSNI
ncbi:hypothetical protein CMU19_04520 [Elizabethkingia anophelis]|nr:hypothetical protein [Elizabethkingia anophelis]